MPHGAKMNKEILGVCALVFNVIGALLVAGATYQLEGYCLFLIGALLWAWQSWLTANRAALLQWAFFTAVNIYGIIQRT